MTLVLDASEMKQEDLLIKPCGKMQRQNIFAFSLSKNMSLGASLCVGTEKENARGKISS